MGYMHNQSQGRQNHHANRANSQKKKVRLQIQVQVYSYTTLLYTEIYN